MRVRRAIAFEYSSPFSRLKLRSTKSRTQEETDSKEKAGRLVALPFELPKTRRPIGITLRAHTSVAPAATLLIDDLKVVVAKILEAP